MMPHFLCKVSFISVVNKPTFIWESFFNDMAVNIWPVSYQCAQEIWPIHCSASHPNETNIETMGFYHNNRHMKLSTSLVLPPDQLTNARAKVLGFDLDHHRVLSLILALRIKSLITSLPIYRNVGVKKWHHKFASRALDNARHYSTVHRFVKG